MRVVWSVARGQMRRWSATASIALLVGLSAGMVMAAVAGASRTDSAMQRFVAYGRPEDAIVVVNGPRGDPSDPAAGARVLATRARVLALPQIAAAGRAPFVFLAASRDGTDVGTINPFAAADSQAFQTFHRPRLLHGRFPRPNRADEAVIDDVTAAQRRLHVGSRLRLWAFSANQMGNPATTVLSKYPVPGGPSYRFRVVGVMRVPSGIDAPPASVTRDAVYGGVGEIHLTPAFLRQYAADQSVPEEALAGMEIFRIRLRHGLTDLSAFERAVARVVTPGDGQVHVGSDTQDAAAKTKGAIHLEAIALLAFAVLGGLAALLILGGALSRQVIADTADCRVLAALGMASRDLTLVPLVRAGVIAVGGAGIAVLVAVVLSPITPIGLARRAEIHPGVSVNVAVLAIGFVSVVALTLLRALLPAWRAARTVRQDADGTPAHSPRLRFAAGLALSPAAVAGMSMSLGRRRGVAFRAAQFATIIGVTGVVAATTFGVSLRHLVDTPREQGWNWDVLVGNPNSTEALTGDPIAGSLQRQLSELLAANPYVGAFSAVALSDATVEGRTVPIAGVETVRGSVLSLVVSGRPPRSAGEIALGEDVLSELHKQIGQTVTVATAGRRATMRIVGEALQPTAGNLTIRLSGGAVATLAGLRRVQPDIPALEFAVRYRPGAKRQAALQSLIGDFGREVLQPYPGGEVGNLARVDALPYLLAGLLVVLAVGALGLTLVGSVRSHRRDLAVLQTIGFVRRQLMAAVAWQATLLAAGALVIGIPAGIALGRWTWRLVASDVGSISPPIVPLIILLLIIPATLLVANLLASGPAWAASRVRPADALRAE